MVSIGAQGHHYHPTGDPGALASGRLSPLLAFEIPLLWRPAPNRRGPARADPVRRVLAARRQHTENAELAAAIKFTQGGKRCSTPLRTEARLGRRGPRALWRVLFRSWFEFFFPPLPSPRKVLVGLLAPSPRA